MVNLAAYEIEADNFLLMFISLYAAERVICWKMENHLSPWVTKVVHSWIWLFGSIGISKGWFALSRQFADSGERWNAALFEWRWLMVMLTTMGMTWGILTFIQLIDSSSDRQKYTIFVCVYALSRVMGYY